MILEDVQLKFTQDDVLAAYREHGLTCGPVALAAVLGLTLDEAEQAVRLAGFKGWMTPTMMACAISHVPGIIRVTKLERSEQTIPWPNHGLARLQWHGPWTQPGANPKWAYRHTHWVSSFRTPSGCMIYDINGGLMTLGEWCNEVVPAITASIPRANGEWAITHSWEVSR